MERLEQETLYGAGSHGYHTYRIPSLAVTGRGALLAFAEGRRDSTKDFGRIDLVLRRSGDRGATWSPTQVLCHEEGMGCGGPAPLVDRETGVVWLVFHKASVQANARLVCEGKAKVTVWVTSSRDDGLTWSTPRDITAQATEEGWSWVAGTACHGIQLSSGRLLVGSDHRIGLNWRRDDPCHSHVVYSDDHGATWNVGGSADEGTNESSVLEAADGAVIINCRNCRPSVGSASFRAVAWSRDGGLSFSPVVRDPSLPDPLCQGSLCRFSTATEGGVNRVLFSNPAGTPGFTGDCLDNRRCLTLRLSHDECRTWPVARVLWEGPAAYSDLCVLDDGTICCAYENGDAYRYERITLARLNLEWLTRGVEA